MIASYTLENLGMGLISAASFGAMGIVLLLVGFKAFEWITPHLDVEKKLQEGSVAVGVTVAGLLVAIATIIAAAIHG